MANQHTQLLSPKSNYSTMNKNSEEQVSTVLLTGMGDVETEEVDRFGYKQEMPKELTMMSILGLSFAIMAVPFGVGTTMEIGLVDGGCVTIFWGWCLVSFLSICIAASLAEICSVYPTAGGVYYWSAILTTHDRAPLASWITGWLTLVGNWTVTTSIVFGGSELSISVIQLFLPDWTPSAFHTLCVFWGFMALCLAVNVFAARHLDFVNTVCVYWTGIAVLAIMVTLVTLTDISHSPSYILTSYDPSPSGWPYYVAFLVGLLQASYTLQGYGMVAAMCDEVHRPERSVPRGMVLSVVAAGLTGVLFIVPVLYVLPDVSSLLASPMPLGLIFKSATGSEFIAALLLGLIVGIFLFAGVGALTASSRCTYAFARDGAIPFSSVWNRVDPRWELPLNGLLLSSVVSASLGLIYLGSSAAFNAFTGVATICLSASNGIPILLNILSGRSHMRNAPYSLGKLGYAVNILSILWIAIAVFLFCMPTAIPVTFDTMNYASVVGFGFSVVSGVWYVLWGRKHFKGPLYMPEDADIVDAIEVEEEVVSIVSGKGIK